MKSFFFVAERPFLSLHEKKVRKIDARRARPAQIQTELR
jgi:hypothetical protein